MNRKQRRRQKHVRKSATKREWVREGVHGNQKISVQPMDLFRAQDAATKRALKSRSVDGFENCISRLGLDQDNALSAGTYDFNLVTRNRILLEMAYRGSWIVGQVVDCVAEDMTREGVDVTTSEAEERLSDFKASFTRLQIFQSLSEGIKWGRLYGGGIGVIDIDGQNLSTPLSLDSVMKGQFRGIMVYDRWMLNPVMDPVIPFGPDAGLPVFYQIVSSLEAGNPSQGAGNQDLYVHHSRCFRFGGIKLPFFQAITEQMWDESVLERLWDRLISFDNATLSTASLIDRANLRTVKLENFREVVAAGGEALDGLQAQFEMMRLAQVNEGLTLLDKNDDFASTSYSFAGIPDTLIQFGQQLSGASQIPLVRLFGQSPAGLNATGDSDIRLYYDGIKAKQEANLRRPFSKLIRVMWRSEFGTPPPKDLDFTFTPLWQTDAKDKAEIGSKNSETIGGAYDRGLITASTALKELRGQAPQTGLFGNITDEDIAQAEAEPPPLPDAAPNPGEEESVGKPEGDREPVQEKKTGDAGNFNENDHPRAKNGEFTSGGGGQSGPSDFKEVSNGKYSIHEREVSSGGKHVISPLRAPAGAYQHELSSENEGGKSILGKFQTVQEAKAHSLKVEPKHNVEVAKHQKDGDLTTYLELNVRDKDGKIIGTAKFGHDSTLTKLTPLDIKVDEEYRRQGIGTSLYQQAEKVSGMKVKASKKQTPEAEAFWKGSKGKFGDSKWRWPWLRKS